jgi:hypothetical protein
MNHVMTAAPDERFLFFGEIPMPFINVPGLTGKLYVPEQIAGLKKKHNCPDCFACQQCGDDRCQVCRCAKNAAPLKPIRIQDTRETT